MRRTAHELVGAVIVGGVVGAVFVGRIRSEEEHPISRPLMRLYPPVAEFSLKYKWLPTTVGAAVNVHPTVLPVPLSQTLEAGANRSDCA